MNCIDDIIQYGNRHELDEFDVVRMCEDKCIYDISKNDVSSLASMFDRYGYDDPIARAMFVKIFASELTNL